VNEGNDLKAWENAEMKKDGGISEVENNTYFFGKKATSRF